MKYGEMVVVGFVGLGIFCWVAWFVLMWPYMIVLAFVHARRAKRGLCVICKAPVWSTWTVPADRMYSSGVVNRECTNGHLVKSGDRHFAEW